MGAKSKQYQAALASALTGAMSMSGMVYLEPLMEQLPLSGSASSWLVAFVELGELVSTLPAGLLADKIGRKTVLLIAGFMCVFSWLVVLWTQIAAVLFIIRFVHGLVLGMAYTAAPMYIAEISEPRIRGELTGHFETLCMFGALSAYVAGPFLPYEYYIITLMALPILFILLFYRMPESPYYLLMIDRRDTAAEALSWLRDTDSVESELKTIEKAVSEELKMKAGWKDLFRAKEDRKAFLIVQVVCLTKYLTGRPAILAYATTIFDQTPKVYLKGYHSTIVLGLLLFLSSAGAAFMSDSIGRRKLLIYSTIIAIIFNLLSGIILYLNDAGVDISSFSWVLIISVIGFFCSTNFGLGSLSGTVQAEFFPSHTRGIGGGISGIVASVGIFINVKQFQPVEDWIGIYFNFLIFAVVGLIGAIVMFCVIPETAGKSLREIQTQVLSK